MYSCLPFLDSRLISERTFILTQWGPAGPYGMCKCLPNRNEYSPPREWNIMPHSTSDNGPRQMSTHLRERFGVIRQRSERLAAQLPVEDQVIQSMPEASPTKWHLAHTTWFFETFVLEAHDEEYSSPFPDEFAHLFNSYYRGAGSFFERSRRGVIGRPTVETIVQYRSHVDEALKSLLKNADGSEEWLSIVEIGCHHEQQHQELLLTDIKHALSLNPLQPVYREDCADIDDSAGAGERGTRKKWLDIEDGLYEIGHDDQGFYFDNEGPRHRVHLQNFQIATEPVTCEEYARFIDDGGYEDSKWWLSEGWDTRCEHDWSAPLYWSRDGDGWQLFTLGGMRPIAPREPVCHVSYFEADAYARWADARLPTEAEWEVASHRTKIDGNFADSARLHPRRLNDDGPTGDISHLFGDVWEWTSSSYAPYPGFEPWDDVLGEYNGKFMCNQYVLRGGSCATPRSHIRRTYRNFFPTDARWQFNGFRLAR